MSNIIFQGQIIFDGEPEKAIIDSNEVAQSIIDERAREYQARLKAVERERRLQEMEDNGVEIPEGMETEEFQDLADSIAQANNDAQLQADEIIADAREQADNMLAQAREEIDAMLAEAQTDADARRNLARQDGQKEGYLEGTQKAAVELANKEAWYDEQVALIQEDYARKQMTMERDVVDICCKVFEKVFGAQLEGKKDILFHLLDNCLMNIEPSHQMQVKVNEANIEMLREKKPEIMNRVGTGVVVDLISDPCLTDSQCLIETDGGVFDCSIDTELDNLIRDIKSLA